MSFRKKTKTIPDDVVDLIGRRVRQEFEKRFHAKRKEYESGKYSRDETQDRVAYTQLQLDSLEIHGKSVWSVMEEELDAHGIEYFPELNEQLNEVAEQLFPETYAKPWGHVLGPSKHPDRVAEKLNNLTTSHLAETHSRSLQYIRGNIDVYCKQLKRKSEERRPVWDFLHSGLGLTIISGLFVIAATLITVYWQNKELKDELETQKELVKDQTVQLKQLATELDQERVARAAEARTVAELNEENKHLKAQLQTAQMKACPPLQTREMGGRALINDAK